CSSTFSLVNRPLACFPPLAWGFDPQATSDHSVHFYKFTGIHLPGRSPRFGMLGAGRCAAVTLLGAAALGGSSAAVSIHAPVHWPARLPVHVLGDRLWRAAVARLGLPVACACRR